MRKGEFFGEGYHHIWNRAIEKKNIFLNSGDYTRFLSALFVFQGNAVFNPFSRATEQIEKIFHTRKINSAEPSRFSGNRDLDKFVENVLSERLVELVAFIIMPNHFHVLVHEIEDEGVSSYMSRVGNSYTKYFNTRYSRKGPLFESSFHSSHIDDQDYLDYLSAYVHKNIGSLKKWRGQEWLYPWSSFRDYVNKNNWGGLLKLDDLLNHFEGGEDYKNFVLDTPIKEDFI